MKIIYILLLFLSYQTVHAQSEVDQSVQLLEKGEISDFSKSFDKTISLTLNNEESSYSQIQASKVLANFFSKNKITMLQAELRSNDNKTNSIYIIGKLLSKRHPEGYRIYLFYSKGKSGFLIREIRIE